MVQHGDSGIKHVHQCVANEQMPVFYIKTNGPVRVSRKGKDLRVDSIAGQAVALPQKHIRFNFRHCMDRKFLE